MSLRFWSNSKSIHTSVQIDDLAWFENSVHGGVVILGIFRDAIAMSSSLYVKQIAEKTLSIIKAIAIAAIADSGALRIDLQKLGEATAAVTATILQSYLESENRDTWPGYQLQGILEDLIKTLNTIEIWISSGQAKNSFGRRKCVKMVKQFQERLSEVLERFELASLLRTYSVLPFIKKMIEEYALSLDAGAARWPSTSPGLAIVGQSNLNPDHKQTYIMEKETHDALRIKVRLILRIIEKEERDRQDESSPADQTASRLNQHPQELEKERKISQPDEPQDSQASKITGDHDNMEQDAVEMLYDMLMARLSNVAIFGPNTLTQSKSSLSSSLPSYSSVNNIRGRHANHLSGNTSGKQASNHVRPTPNQLNLEKPLPPIVDTSGPWKYTGYISQTRKVERVYEFNRPFYRVIRGMKPRGCASLPPGAMPPIVSTASLLNELNKVSGRSRLPPSSTRHERILIATPLPIIGEEDAESRKSPQSLNAHPSDKETTSPLSPEEKESIQSSRPPLSGDADQEDRPTNPDRQVPAIAKPTSDDDPGKEKGLIPDATRPTDAQPSFNPLLPVSIDPGKSRKLSSPPPLPPGAMPPKLSSWSPPPSSVEIKEIPPGHRGAGPGPIANSNSIPLSSTKADGNLLPAIQSSSSPRRHPELTLNDSATNFRFHNKEESTNYHLPPITIASPITMTPLLVVGAESSLIPNLPTQLPLPPLPRPKHLGPGYEHLQKMSPQMQRYVERLADRIWGGSEGVR